MPDPRRVLEFAKRVFPEKEAAAGHARRIADTLEHPTHDEGLELAGLGPPLPPARRRHIMQDLPSALRAGAAALPDIHRLTPEGLDPDTQFGLEAIVLLVGRPALLIQDGTFGPAGDMWEAKLAPKRAAIKDAITRVGRIELKGHPTYPWVGTGFLVGPGVIMTNRHVAVTFAREGGSTFKFMAGVTASVDFKEEYQRDASQVRKISKVIGIHPKYDLALLKLDGEGGPKPLEVASAPPPATKDYDIVVIGYPAYDSRNDAAEMIRIFDNIFNVKRLQPGMLTGLSAGAGGLQIAGHDCSTLGGNSGSVVFDFTQGQAVGLHFGGRYLEGNTAVPLWRLKNDALLKKAKVNFV